KFLENYLNQKHIAYSAIPIDSDTRENFVAMETATHAHYRFVLPGPVLSQKEADACIQLLLELKPSPKIIIAGGSLPPGFPENFYGRLASMAKQMGAKFMLDTSPKNMQPALQEGVFLIKPNLTELCALVGKSKLQLNEVEDAALSILRKKFAEVVVV